MRRGTGIGAPDPAALALHCRWLLVNGCDGLSILGTTGEAKSLTVDERIALLERLVADGIPAQPFSPALIGRLIERYPENIVGMKDNSGELANMVGAARRFAGFDVFCGSDETGRSRWRLLRPPLTPLSEDKAEALAQALDRLGFTPAPVP